MAVEKLILLEDVENLGLAGEEVSVASGYARNFLVPRGLATKATPGALRQVASRREKIEKRRQEETEAAKSLAEKIAEAEISISMQAGEDDQLFGSVGARIIAEKLAELGIEVEHQRIKLEEPIKSLGVFNIDIKLQHDVSASVKVWVTRAA